MPHTLPLLAPISDYALISPRCSWVYFPLASESTGLRAFVPESGKFLGSKPNSQLKSTSDWINNNRELSFDIILSFLFCTKYRSCFRKSGSCVSSWTPGLWLYAVFHPVASSQSFDPAWTESAHWSLVYFYLIKPLKCAQVQTTERGQWWETDHWLLWNSKIFLTRTTNQLMPPYVCNVCNVMYVMQTVPRRVVRTRAHYNAGYCENIECAWCC